MARLMHYCRPRMLFMLTLGFSSGLPLALTSGTLQAWYTVAGLSLIGIGFLNLIGQPYAYKFLWAPLFDRYIPPLLGRRRGWVLLTQLAIIITIILMATLTPQTHPYELAGLGLLLAFFSASQDVNLDAYRTDLLEPEERALGSAFWLTGYRAALLVSGGLALILAEYLGWRPMLLLMAGLMGVGVITTFICETTPTDLNRPENLQVAISEPFKEFFSRPYVFLILLLIVLYKFTDAFALSLSTAFYLRELGFSLAEVGTVMKTMTIIGTIVGIFLGGMIMLRLKLYSSLFYFGILQAISNFMYVLMAIIGKNYLLFISSILIENIAGGMATIAFMTFLMGLCDKRYTATQFSLISAFAAIGRIFVGPFAGFIVIKTGWPNFFLFSVAIAVPSLILLYYLKNKIDFNAEQIR